jgi:hypothetical protein
MLADELHTVLNLKEKLAERVVGQDQALDAIARRVRTFRADLDDPGKPVACSCWSAQRRRQDRNRFALADCCTAANATWSPSTCRSSRRRTASPT